jgi:hypothetical protein
VNKDKELAVEQERQNYLAITENAAVKNIIQVNFGDSGLKLTDLSRIKMPTGGGISWTIETDKGVKSVDELKGIILYHKEIRAYWVDPNSIGEPPVCKSDDTVHGAGKPGGMCYVCPKAQFGSRDKGTGQACKTMRIVYLLQKDSLLPVVLQLPPTSLKIFRAYLMQLTTHMLTYEQVETSFKLEIVSPKNAPKYSIVNVSNIRNLDEVETAAIGRYATMFTQLVEKQGVPIQGETVEGSIVEDTSDLHEIEEEKI